MSRGKIHNAQCKMQNAKLKTKAGASQWDAMSVEQNNLNLAVSCMGVICKEILFLL